VRHSLPFPISFRVACVDFTLEMLSIGDPTKKQNAKKHVLHVCSSVSQKNEEKTKKKKSRNKQTRFSHERGTG